MAKVSFDASKLIEKNDRAFWTAVNATKRAAQAEASQHSKRMARGIYYDRRGKRVAELRARKPATRFWGSIEIGSKPHTIAPKEGGVLRFWRDGEPVFTRKPVQHPGTPAKRPIRIAVDRVFFNAYVDALRRQIGGGR